MGGGGVRRGPSMTLRAPVEGFVIVNLGGWASRARRGCTPRRSCVLISAISMGTVSSLWLATVTAVGVVGRVS